MVLDFYTNTLFWSTFNRKSGSDVANSIHCSKLNGQNELKFVISENIVQRRITVDKNYIYYPMRGDYSTIVRIHKNNGTRDLNFNITNYNHTVKSYAIDLINLGLPQEIRVDHPCQINNGGCTGLCLALHIKNGKLKKVCK